MVYVGSDPVFGGDVQVGGSMRGGERKGCYLLPGGYRVGDGVGSLLVYDVSEGDMTFHAVFFNY